MPATATATATTITDRRRCGDASAPVTERVGRIAGSRHRVATLALASSMVISFLAASAAPTPLYDRYEAMWHATPLIGTIAFAVYALAVLVALLWLGELAAHVGRRPVLLAALGGQIVALALTAAAGSFTLILVARVIQGLAAGAALGTLSATMIESDGERGPIASAASPAAGTGLGTMLSGLAVSLLPAPTHTIYVVLIAVMAVQVIGVMRLIAPVTRRPIPRAALRPRIAVPAAARRTFVAGGSLMFSVWAFAGFDAALSPALYRELSGDASVWQSALPLFLFAATGSVATFALRRASGRPLTVLGASALVAGLGTTVLAVALHSVSIELAASVIAGVGFGAGFQGPLRELVALVAPQERAGLLSAVFVVAYVALGVPAIVAGALVTSGVALTTVTTALALVLTVLTGAALLSTLRARG